VEHLTKGIQHAARKLRSISLLFGSEKRFKGGKPGTETGTERTGARGGKMVKNHQIQKPREKRLVPKSKPGKMGATIRKKERGWKVSGGKGWEG